MAIDGMFEWWIVIRSVNSIFISYFMRQPASVTGLSEQYVFYKYHTLTSYNTQYAMTKEKQKNMRSEDRKKNGRYHSSLDAIENKHFFAIFKEKTAKESKQFILLISHWMPSMIQQRNESIKKTN